MDVKYYQNANARQTDDSPHGISNTKLVNFYYLTKSRDGNFRIWR